MLSHQASHRLEVGVESHLCNQEESVEYYECRYDTRRFSMTARRQAMPSVILVCVLASGGLSAGCAAPRSIQARQARHVVVLPGILGAHAPTRRLARLIEEELEGTSAQVWDWTDVRPTLLSFSGGSTTNFPLNLARARILANHLTDFKRREPNTDVSVIAYSGGAGIILFACDSLPNDVKLERIILLAGGVSPGYDLGAALDHTEAGLVNYYSKRDTLVLGFGTKLMGTMDRIYCESAGMVGFRPDAFTGREDKVQQIEWRESSIVAIKCK